MKPNIEFLVISYFVGLFVDWMFQWQWQATNKSKWGKEDNKWLSLAAVITHAVTYASFTSVITSSLLNASFNKVTVFIVLFVTHAFIDTRIPVKWLMRVKGLTKAQIQDTQRYGFMQLGIDHRLHELVLLILAFTV